MLFIEISEHYLLNLILSCRTISASKRPALPNCNQKISQYLQFHSKKDVYFSICWVSTSSNHPIIPLFSFSLPSFWPSQPIYPFFLDFSGDIPSWLQNISTLDDDNKPAAVILQTCLNNGRMLPSILWYLLRPLIAFVAVFLSCHW